jgi:hypothetical protein
MISIFNIKEIVKREWNGEAVLDLDFVLLLVYS